MALDPNLLEILACPECKATLREHEDAGELACSGCRLVYPVQDGIPVLLADAARRPS